MSAPGPYQPHTLCPACGYDMQPLLATGIRRCPECGKMVPRGIFLHIEPKHATWYIGFIFILLVPAAMAIMARLVLVPAARNPLWALPDALVTAWSVLTPLYCYALSFLFCRAHRLPRAAFGALPVSIPVSVVNFIFAATILAR